MDVNIVVEWVECLLIIGTGYWVQVLTRSSIAKSVCQQAFGLLEILFPRPWVRILHSPEEDSLSPFDSKIACPCQASKSTTTYIPPIIWMWIFTHTSISMLTSRRETIKLLTTYLSACQQNTCSSRTASEIVLLSIHWNKVLTCLKKTFLRMDG